MRDEAPIVSVVMVAYGGGWAWVPRALEALRRNTAETYEVILVDNGGASDRPVPDPTTVELVRNDENIGFGPASNLGVARAQGEVVCLLNTDVLVEPGWLPPLLDHLANDRVGAVVPAKLHLDGRLQEAGAFVTGDAHVHVFGDGDDADAPEYRFRREVDFGSAAAICMTRRRYEAFGGFDPAYRIAYFEDTDLCYRLREKGLRVVYEPRARVKHARGVSVPTTADVAQAVVANQAVFLSRWGRAIEGRPTLEEVRADARFRLTARDLHAQPRVLLLGDGDSTPQVAGELARAHPTARVTLLVGAIEQPAERALLDSGVEVVQTDRDRDWLVERARHYSHVVRPEQATWLRLGTLLRDTQPQARFVDGVGPEELQASPH